MMEEKRDTMGLDSSSSSSSSGRLHFILSCSLTSEMIDMAWFLGAAKRVKLTVYSPKLYEPPEKALNLENLQSLCESSVKVVQMGMKMTDISEKMNEYRKMIEGCMEVEQASSRDCVLSDPSLFSWIKETADKFEMPLFCVDSSSSTGPGRVEWYNLRHFERLSSQQLVNTTSSFPPIPERRFSLKEICSTVVQQMHIYSSSTTLPALDPDPPQLELLLRDKEVIRFVVIAMGSNSPAAVIGRKLYNDGESVRVFYPMADPSPSKELDKELKEALNNGPRGIIADRNIYWILETACMCSIPLFNVSWSRRLDYVLGYYQPSLCVAAVGASGRDAPFVTFTAVYDWDLNLESICTIILQGGEGIAPPKNRPNMLSQGVRDWREIDDGYESYSSTEMSSPPESLEIEEVDPLEADIAAENEEPPPADAATLAAINGLHVFMQERFLDLLGEVHVIPPEISVAVGLLHREKTAIRKLNKLIMRTTIILLPFMVAIFSSIMWILWKISSHQDKMKII